MMPPEPLKVLLIEHDESFARSLTGMFGQTQLPVNRVEHVNTLPLGLEKLAGNGFNVVILDFFLPDGAGSANIGMLRDTAAQVPIIVVGGADDEAVALEAVHAGAQDYLVRGQLNPQGLNRSIRYAMERNVAEQAVTEAEEKYRGIFDHLVEGIFQTSPDGRYLMANAALARIYGYASPEELKAAVTDIGRRLYVQPGRREEFKRIMEELDTITGFESQIFRKDGSIIWISENCRAVRDARGNLLYYEGTVEDITLRREAQENLRGSEALYHSLVDTMPQNVFRKDLQGRFTFANKQYCKHYNCRLEDILGKTDFDFFPKELAEKYRSDDQRVMAGGQTYDIVEEHQPLGQGRSFVRVVKTPLFGSDGTLIGLQGIFWDITKERLMEENLRNSEALYHSLVETLPQNIYRKDLQGRYTFANARYCKTLGKPLEEVLGKTIFDFLPLATAELRARDDQQVIATGKVFEAVEENKFRGGENTYIQVFKVPIFDIAGNIIGLQCMFWDITQERLAAERVRRANAELAQSREALRLQNLRMEDDLKMASEIQLTMLPQQYPLFPSGVSPADSAIKFTHRYHPTGTVGGDFFTVSSLSDHEAAVFICDVAGHGVRSALVTAMIRALVEELKPLAGDPGAFLTKLNSELGAILKHAGMPVLTTAFYLVVNASTGVMRFANAAHPKPLVARRNSGQIETLKPATKTSQPALGLFEKAAYQTFEITLAPSDLVLLFTDGLYEVQSPAQELYTQEMLTAAANKNLSLPTAQLFDSLLQEVKGFAAGHEFTDDVCVVGVELARLIPVPVSKPVL
jgi:sigma-B regulation protein RsbU (phosphoserine phosphatase)